MIIIYESVVKPRVRITTVVCPNTTAVLTRRVNRDSKKLSFLSKKKKKKASLGIITYVKPVFLCTTGMNNHKYNANLGTKSFFKC